MPSSAGSALRTSFDQSLRARSAGIAQKNQSASIRRRRPCPSTALAETTLPPRICSPVTRWPSSKRTPSRFSSRTHGLIQASFVGALRTRSRLPSLPRCMMFMTNASPMFPIVRVLATCSFAATSERVRPRAMIARYSSEKSSARTKSHQVTFSHSPKRRSSQLVTKTSSRLTK